MTLSVVMSRESATHVVGRSLFQLPTLQVIELVPSHPSSHPRLRSKACEIFLVLPLPRGGDRGKEGARAEVGFWLRKEQDTIPGRGASKQT